MKLHSKPFILIFVMLFVLTACGKLSNEVEKLNELKTKVESIDSLVDNEINKVKKLDTIIKKESDKVKKLDTLIRKSTSQIDSISQKGNNLLKKITN